MCSADWARGAGRAGGHGTWAGSLLSRRCLRPGRGLRDDLAGLEDQGSGWVGDDGLARGGGGEEDQVGRAAGGQAVGGEAEDLGAAGGGQLEGGGQVLVAAGAGSPGGAGGARGQAGGGPAG